MAFPPVPFQEWFLRQTSAGNAALNAYVARVKADGGVVEAIGCVPLAVWDWVAPVAPSFVGLLDLFPNAAAAYSLRKLRAAYGGAAVRVRESGGNTEADIGFTSAGELDTSALLAHCGANDGFVTVWYDQSLSNDATQSTAANQPKIVNAGSLVTENGKAAIEFDGVNDHMPNGVGTSTPADISAFAVRGISSYPSTFRTLFNYKVFGLTHNSNGGNSYGNGAHIFKSTIDVAKSDNYPTITGQAVDAIINKTNLERNAFAATLSTGGAYGNGISGIGSWSGTSQTFIGTIQELVIYESDESTNKSGIKSNINNFYSIY